MCVYVVAGESHRKHTRCKGCYLDRWKSYLFAHLLPSSPAGCTCLSLVMGLWLLSEVSVLGILHPLGLTVRYRSVLLYLPGCFVMFDPLTLLRHHHFSFITAANISCCGLTVLKPNTPKQVSQYPDGQSREIKGQSLYFATGTPIREQSSEPRI